MAILNPFDILDADEENPTKLLENFERKMIAQARIEAEAEDARWEANREAIAIKENKHEEYLKEKNRKGEVRNRIARGRVAAGNGPGKRGNYSRNIGNGNYNRTSENGVNNKVNGKVGYRNGNAGGDKARSYQRNRKEKIENGDAGLNEIKASSDEVSTQEAVEIAKADDTSSNSEKLAKNEESLESNPEKHVKKAESLESDANKDKEEEVKTYTLTEYEKMLEEKRKPLLAMKTSEERKVLDKEFESMRQVSLKKENDEIFIKLGSEKGSQDKRVKKASQGKAQVSDDNKVKSAVLKVFQVKSRPRPQFRETYGTQASAPAAPINGSVGGQLSSPAISNGGHGNGAPSNVGSGGRTGSSAGPSNWNGSQIRGRGNNKPAPAIEDAKDFPPLK